MKSRRVESSQAKSSIMSFGMPATIEVTPRAADTKSTTGDANHRSRQEKTSQVSRRHRSSTHSKRNGGDKSTSHNKECVCGMGTACFGMTQAFRMLKDQRCHFVELPRHRKDPTDFKLEFRNNLRKSYLRELLRQNPTNETLKEQLSSETSTSVPKVRQYIALHHFHPTVVQAFYEKSRTSGKKQKHKVPVTITGHELGELGMDCREENRILSVGATPTDGFYFTPSYSHKAAHNDLKELILSIRSSQGNRSDKKTSRRNRVTKRRTIDQNIPTSIEITTQKTDTENHSRTKPNPFSNEEKRIRPSNHGNKKLVRVEGNKISKKCANDTNTLGVMSEVPGSGGDHADDIDTVRYKSCLSAIESSVISKNIIKKDYYCNTEGRDEVENQHGFTPGSAQPKMESFALRRSIDRPLVTPSAYIDFDTSMRDITSSTLDRLSTVSTALAKVRVLVGADSFRLPMSPSRVQQQYYKTLQTWSQPPALLALSAADGTSCEHTANRFTPRYGSLRNKSKNMLDNSFDENDDDSVNSGAAASLSLVDYIGLSCQPMVWMYLYATIATTTGSGLPSGLGESIGALKGLPYLIVLVLAVLPNSSEVETYDKGGGSFLNIQTLSRITIALGLLILAGLAAYRGYVPHPKPIFQYSANICRFVAASN